MYATYKIGKDLFLGILQERRKFYKFLQYEFFPFFPPLYIHTYINSLVGFYLKHEELVNEHDAKHSS